MPHRTVFHYINFCANVFKRIERAYYGLLINFPFHFNRKTLWINCARFDANSAEKNFYHLTYCWNANLPCVCVIWKIKKIAFKFCSASQSVFIFKYYSCDKYAVVKNGCFPSLHFRMMLMPFFRLFNSRKWMNEKKKPFQF